MRLSIICLGLASLVAILQAEESLYQVLGVGKSASAKEIKAAYKTLAKEWHPDKNPDPSANERFMKINEAYTTLSDKEKRAEYDNFGTTSAQADGGRRGGYDESPFGHFFRQEGFGSFNFRFGGNRHESNVGKYRLSLRNYKDSILPESDKKPYLIYAYADFCYQCVQIEGMWDKIVQDMNTIGMGVGSVHASLDRALASRLQISDVPSIMMVIDGHVKFFKGRLSLQDLRDFVRGQLPKDIVTEVTDKNYKEFLGGWQDNRVRMLFFGSRPLPTLRYMIPAYANRQRVAAGYVNLAHINSEDLQYTFNVPKGMESLLMFNENSDRPMAQFTMSGLSLSTLTEAIESNQFLVLPRLSSQEMFNTLCPLHTSIRRKKLCVILLAHSKPEHRPYMDSFRDYAKTESNTRLKFAYIYEDRQGEFVSKLTKGEGALNATLNTLKVAVVWRSEQRQVQYDWLSDGWAAEESENTMSRRRLTDLIQDSLRSRDVLPFSMEMITDLVDENRGLLFYRIMKRLARWGEMGWEMLLSMDEMTLITFGTTVGFIVVIALMMKMMITGDEDRYGNHAQHRQNRPQPPMRRPEPPVVQLNTLCAETFRGVVMDVPAGVRTIVILVNHDSKQKILQDFASVVQPYARSDAFRFAFLQLEEYLPWYKELLEASLDHNRTLDNININNCIGTVLALNGKRKYFSVYHAAAESALYRRNRRSRRPQNSQVGDFLGMNDSDSEWETDGEGEGEGGGDDRLLDSMLLAGLPTWMDRLCEGTLRRLRVDNWPPMASFS